MNTNQIDHLKWNLNKARVELTQFQCEHITQLNYFCNITFFCSGQPVGEEQKKKETKEPDIPLIETGIAPNLGWVLHLCPKAVFDSIDVIWASVDILSVDFWIADWIETYHFYDLFFAW